MPAKEYYWKNREQYLIDSMKWQKEHKEEVRKYRTPESRKAYRERDYVRVKNKAREKVSTEIRAGRLKRQVCEARDCSDMGQAHHPDYSKPLYVLWLCQYHHAQLHHKGFTLS